MSLEAFLGYSFKDKTWLERALTHKSSCYEKGSGGLGHNEVLEFLGDSVLGLSLARLLLEKFPADDEGVLSKKRASLENEAVLARLARDLDLGLLLILGKGERQSGGAERPRLLASALEALVGAVERDGGILEADRVVRRIFEPLLSSDDWESGFDQDYKTRFQEIIQKKFSAVPDYRLIAEEGPAHARSFSVELYVRDEKLAVGRGSSKKSAEQDAARQALVLYRSSGEESL